MKFAPERTCELKSFHCLRLVKLHLPLPVIMIFLAGRGIFSSRVTLASEPDATNSDAALYAAIKPDAPAPITTMSDFINSLFGGLSRAIYEKRESLAHRTATTSYLCCLPALEDLEGAGRVRLSRCKDTNIFQILLKIIGSMSSTFSNFQISPSATISTDIGFPDFA